MPQARAQDDFFRHVNGAWIAANPIPNEESRWGSFIVLRYETEQHLKKLVEKTANPLIRDFYQSGMDMKKRNELGAKPLAPLLAEVAKLKTREGLTLLLAHLEVMGVSVPFSIIVDQDAKNSTRYIAYIEQGGLGLPDRDYYLKNDAEKTRVREAYKKHGAQIFALLGDSPKVADDKMRVVMKVETALARASMNKVSMRDPDKTYHKKSLTALERHAPTIKWKKYFDAIGAPKFKDLILSQPKFITAVDHLARTLSIADWQVYLSFHIANSAAGALSQEFIEENFDFYGRTLSGQKEMKPLWRRALGAVNAAIGEEVGKVYVKKFFTPAAKRKMEKLVGDLFDAFEARLKKLTWMSPATKRRAFKKLRSIVPKIGYPTKWKSYKGLVIRPDDYFGNLIRADIHEHKRAMRKIGKPIDRTEWFMTPQTVNAYYSPTMNEIVFPAAILQPPFFGLTQDEAVNYGAIGSTIGHEITHGFDDSGAKFDEKGNLKRWWSAADKKRFEKKAALLARHYDAYEAAPGAKVNGKLTLGENIADLGGLAIAYDAFTKKKRTAGELKKFFMGWAEAEREHARLEYLRMIVMVDPHSPAEFRINGPASNFAPFYEAFKLGKGDNLWRDPKNRAEIW